MDDFMKTTGCVALVIWIFVSAFLSVVINGWVLSLMWAWFVVEKFGLPALSLKEAILLASLVALLVITPSVSKVQDNRSRHEKIADTLGWTVGIIIRPLLALGFFYAILMWF